MYNNNFQNQNMGMGVNVNRPQKIRATNGLSVEEWKERLNNNKAVSSKITLTENDLIKCKCTHRDPVNYNSVLVQKSTGDYYCPVCGREFTFDQDIDVEKATQICKDFIDLAETIKTIWMTIPVNFIEEYFEAEALVEKFPLILDLAIKNFNTITKNTNPYQYNNRNNSGFQMLGNIYGGGMNQYNPYQYQQQNMMNTPMNMNNMGGYNNMQTQGYLNAGFGYNSPAEAAQQQQFDQNRVNLPGTGGSNEQPKVNTNNIQL